MAAEGFDQLDRGEGIELHGEEEVRDFIARIGHRVRERKKLNR
jgi:hypothetical protein